MKKLLLGAGGVAAPRLHDIVAIGLQVMLFIFKIEYLSIDVLLQEMVPLNIKNVALSDSVKFALAFNSSTLMFKNMSADGPTYSMQSKL